MGLTAVACGAVKVADINLFCGARLAQESFAHGLTLQRAQGAHHDSEQGLSWIAYILNIY